ncbi:hypothetical protein [Streptomyces sp. Rer75]|uniref:hypothetical protein n=1 Tax=unclassified Streptomyces TaxID=2593676 RepID=UPI0015D02DBF|nr:hypothetical protein [Streptomyces sp. Rer75]QLH26580.1 hypothetical protein HYQ63_43145 [Streptomyces sp. Rer75]
MTVAVARIRHATMSVQGPAIHHARLLINDVVPDALRVSCVDDVIRIEAPEADLRIQLRPTLAGDGTRLSFCATFREDKPAGGTWWSSWETEVRAQPHSRHVGEIIADEIRRSRTSFAHALPDPARDPARSEPG